MFAAIEQDSKVEIDSPDQGVILRRLLDLCAMFLQPDIKFGESVARWQSGYAAACKAADIGSIPFLASNSFSNTARVAELVDATDLKSVFRKEVRVRVSPRAPKQYRINQFFEGRTGHLRRVQDGSAAACVLATAHSDFR